MKKSLHKLPGTLKNFMYFGYAELLKFLILSKEEPINYRDIFIDDGMERKK